uniref:Uncharacterized protein n=1 Tax=Gallus gallus TaxID=9031 RepID=A0A8V0YCL7_CHICK
QPPVSIHPRLLRSSLVALADSSCPLTELMERPGVGGGDNLKLRKTLECCFQKQQSALPPTCPPLTQDLCPGEMPKFTKKEVLDIPSLVSQPPALPLTSTCSSSRPRTVLVMF